MLLRPSSVSDVSLYPPDTSQEKLKEVSGVVSVMEDSLKRWVSVRSACCSSRGLMGFPVPISGASGWVDSTTALQDGLMG